MKPAYTRFLLAALALPAATAGAASITRTGTTNMNGTGFGNVLTTLALQAQGSEAGSVLWNGTSDVRTGDATNQSQTQTVATLSANGINGSNLAFVFNLTEPGNGTDVTLQGFTVRFLSPTGATLFDAVYGTTEVLETINQGNGGAGHLFSVSLTPAEATQFFSNPLNRVGVLVTNPILNTGGGPETFFVVPSPSALAALGLAVVARRRRRA